MWCRGGEPTAIRLYATGRIKIKNRKRKTVDHVRYRSGDRFAHVSTGGENG
jgi:hypothetical protein